MPPRQLRAVQVSLHLDVSIETSELLFQELCTLDPGTYLRGREFSHILFLPDVRSNQISPFTVPWESKAVSALC